MELGTEIEVVKTRVEEHDSAIDKLTDISLSLRDIVMEHKTKIAATQEDVRDIKDNNVQLARDLKNDTQAIAKELREHNDKNVEGLKKEFKEEFTNLKELFTSFSSRVSSLEKYRWLVVGAVGLATFLIGLAIEYLTGAHPIKLIP